MKKQYKLSIIKKNEITNKFVFFTYFAPEITKSFVGISSD